MCCQVKHITHLRHNKTHYKRFVEVFKSCAIAIAAIVYFGTDTNAPHILLDFIFIFLRLISLYLISETKFIEAAPKSVYITRKTIIFDRQR